LVKKVVQNPEGAPRPVGAYSQVVRVESGDTAWLYIAGQVSVDAEGRIVGEGDIAAQTAQIFENLRVLLAANGATFADLVKTNTYILDMAHRAAVAEVRNRYLTTDLPTSTLVAVSQLARPEWLIEVEAVAAVQI
jgi:2-iminobutanoate/2-iminopropanoate deaminase